MRQQILNLFTTPRDMSWEDILLNIVLAAVLGFFIFLSYAISHRGTIYSRKFNASLVILAVLTGTVMTVIGNNIALSLGMVGALSIVRFRTAVKDPLDLLYLFWSITAGITTGAGMYLLAVAASAVMIGVVVFLSRWQTAGRSYVAVLHYQGEKPGDEIVRALGRNKFAVKSKTLRAEGTELAVEVCCRDNASEVTDRLRSIEGVEDVTMIQYNGEYHG